MTSEQRKTYSVFLENSCTNNENANDLLLYGKGVKPEQRFFWMCIYIQNIDTNIARMYTAEDFKLAEPKRQKLFVQEILKIAMGYLIWYYKRNTVAISYTLDKFDNSLQKHPVFATGYSENSRANAYQVVREELLEFQYALHSESKDRQISEAMDVAITCSRYLNHEWEE